MIYDEFVLISRMVHLNDFAREIERGHEGHDPWSKVRFLLDKVNLMAKRYYTPSRYIGIDESMIDMKNRLIFIQFMPNKRHARFGIKKFQLCDNNGYVIHVDLYSGKELDVQHSEGQAFGVVEKLLRESQLLFKGFHLFTDNYYTKPKLGEYLLERDTLLTGTVRHNSKGVPENVFRKIDVGVTQFWRKNNGGMLALAFREKKSKLKPVLALSTAHKAGVEERRIRGKDVKKLNVHYL
ncbi:PiggyBac transposable element-derived protein 4 [Plakobranchus ocellatus]|uniref:PiggyBac transposable element-derived protein 4 n=1 Tax=Plakobranchus ocellatus TaxID=259542 RepID=A0AAV4CAN4_9GAST|nr:PiggyBac transposable element-derived protein 4 [Plakobranchus ocellatus]